MSVWTYQQSTGALTDPAGKVIAHGYSGNGEGLNNPAKQSVRSIGPIPAGMWFITLKPLEHTDVGPLALPLSPLGHTALGRSLFRIHGDNKLGNHSASHGCVIMPRDIRQKIIDAGVTYLHVVA